MLQENARLTDANVRLLSDNESLLGSNSSLIAQNRELTEKKERVSGELAVIESDRRKLTAEDEAVRKKQNGKEGNQGSQAGGGIGESQPRPHH